MRFLAPAARHLLAGGLLGLVVALASWVDPLGYYFSVAELKALDSQFDLRGPLPASSPIVVGVDEDSFDALNLPWPWPRELHAEFIDIVTEAGRHRTISSSPSRLRVGPRTTPR